jgi:hypothetical protein
MDNTTYLSLTAADALAGMLQEVYASNSQVMDVLENWTTATVNASASTYTVSSNALSDAGVVGQYIGSITFPYQKRNLNSILPYPFVFPWAYPTNMATVQTFFQQNFNITLEDGEFTVTNNGQSGPLSGSDVINATPDPVSGHVTFVAQASSGRFVAGSSFSIRCTASGVQVPLNILLALSTNPNLDILSDH